MFFKSQDKIIIEAFTKNYSLNETLWETLDKIGHIVVGTV